MLALIGKKIGMTQLFNEEGVRVPVSVVEVEPNTVVQARTKGLLKRFLATPMRKGEYLLSYMLSRLVFLVIEVAATASGGLPSNGKIALLPATSIESGNIL